MSLEVKTQKAKNEWLFLRINCSKKCARDFSSGWNASSKCRLKHLEFLIGQETNGWYFWRLGNIEKRTKHDSTGCKTLSKIKYKYLEVKFKEPKFGWCLVVKKQKPKKDCLILSMNSSKQRTRDFSRGWNASSKVRPNCLEVLKYQESYGWCFWRLNDIEKGAKYDFTGCTTLSKVTLK